jgi:hypothetical protein
MLVPDTSAAASEARKTTAALRPRAATMAIRAGVWRQILRPLLSHPSFHQGTAPFRPLEGPARNDPRVDQAGDQRIDGDSVLAHSSAADFIRPIMPHFDAE